jgi:hypothetical protein
MHPNESNEHSRVICMLGLLPQDELTNNLKGNTDDDCI